MVHASSKSNTKLEKPNGWNGTSKKVGLKDPIQLNMVRNGERGGRGEGICYCQIFLTFFFLFSYYLVEPDYSNYFEHLVPDGENIKG